MDDTKQQLRRFKATELKLLQDRTKLQRRVEESLRTAGWPRAELALLEEQREALESELAAVRSELWRLERESAPPE
jgi:hypothetical protein